LVTVEVVPEEGVAEEEEGVEEELAEEGCAAGGVCANATLRLIADATTTKASVFMEILQVFCLGSI
jgi:hypothetical protein